MRDDERHDHTTRPDAAAPGGDEPVPQHRERLDDPDSRATIEARQAAERFAIDEAQRRLTMDGSGARRPTAGPGHSGASHEELGGDSRA